MNYNTVHIFLFAFIMMLLGVSCEPDHETKDVSTVVYLPRFEVTGGSFVSFEQGTREDYIDPGIVATVDGLPVAWEKVSGVDTVPANRPGVYLMYYSAKNDAGLYNSARRVVVVTEDDVTTRDFSGDYFVSSLWGPQEAKVTKKHEGGLYACTEILGFPGVEYEGEFVDVGDNMIGLLPDEGPFGDYALDEGDFTSTTLSWTVEFLDPPNTGFGINVGLVRKDD